MCQLSARRNFNLGAIQYGGQANSKLERIREYGLIDDMQVMMIKVF